MMIIIEIILNDYLIKMKKILVKDEESVHMNTYVAGSFY